MSNIQKLSIRLLREDYKPSIALRDGAELNPWKQFEESYISYGTLGGKSPKWVDFLDFPDTEKSKIVNNNSFCVVFLYVSKRWFAISFGMGHVKINSEAIEQGFGLKIVLNSVDENSLKSADIRTPDENSLVRRTQTSRGANQNAFNINVETDLIKGLSGTPQNATLGSYMAGSDALTLHRKAELKDLSEICKIAFTQYQKNDYKKNFSWIDKISNERQETVIKSLKDKLITSLTLALTSGTYGNLDFAFPIIYNPEKFNFIKYTGFNSRKIYPDISIEEYINDLKNKGFTSYKEDYLKKHKIQECDDRGKSHGEQWKVYDFLVYETILDGNTYILSAGLWYKIDKTLATEVESFFNSTKKIKLPSAKEKENESQYNERISKEGRKDLLCMDKELLTPSGATTKIETCDFFSKKRKIIHIKDKTSSSRLSHLFSQGYVSACILKQDPTFRDKLRLKISETQTKLTRSGFDDIIPASSDVFKAEDYTVVFAVMTNKGWKKLPFFSLISFRQAVNAIKSMDYKCEFAWIEKEL